MRSRSSSFIYQLKTLPISSAFGELADIAPYPEEFIAFTKFKRDDQYPIFEPDIGRLFSIHAIISSKFFACVNPQPLTSLQAQKLASGRQDVSPTVWHQGLVR